MPESPANFPAGIGGNGMKLVWTYRGVGSLGQGIQATHGHPRDTYSGTTSLANPNPLCLSNTYGEAQDAKWVWAEPYGKLALDPVVKTSSLKVFGMNNLNFGNPVYNQPFTAEAGGGNWGGTSNLLWHYHQMPEDGTYAVIDEFKISSKDRVLVDTNNPDWNNDRAFREMRTSRYYLPPNPGSRQDPAAGGPPTFTSQTLLQSRKGFEKITDSKSAAIVRVSWNVFTPRFMSEYKEPGLAPFNRNEKITHYATITAPQAVVSLPFKGPFDYVRYNDDADVTAYSVNRMPPWASVGGLTQAGKGVEIELLQDVGGAITILDGKTFTNPVDINALGSINAPVRCLPSQLRYRVRFRYPVDPQVDPFTATTDVNGMPCINPAKQYLLDTPVFDDISVTYILPTQILDFRELTE
jgi:hypothetical protein